MPVIPGSSAATVTVNDLIKSALRLLGAIAAGESPTAEELLDGLSALNSMIDSWNNERLMIYKVDVTENSLTAGTADYTLGPGADWDGARPNKIEGASLKVNGIETPLEVLTLQKWALVPDKAASGTPYALYNDGTYPLTTVTVYPTPIASDSVVLYCPNQVSRFVLGDSVLLPPGYEEALKYGLAVRYAAEFGVDPKPFVVQTAMEAKANLKRANSVTPEMSCDGALLDRGYFDIRTGRYQ